MVRRTEGRMDGQTLFYRNLLAKAGGTTSKFEWTEKKKSSRPQIGQYQGKPMIQLWENGKNPNLGPSLGPLKFFHGF